MYYKNFYVDLEKREDYETLEELLNNLEFLGLNYELVSHYQIDYRTKKPKPFIDAPYMVGLEISRLRVYDSPSKLSPSSLKFICNSLTIKVNVKDLTESDLISLNDFVNSFIKERF